MKIKYASFVLIGMKYDWRQIRFAPSGVHTPVGKVQHKQFDSQFHALGKQPPVVNSPREQRHRTR